jgi:hypothetical protein
MRLKRHYNQFCLSLFCDAFGSSKNHLVPDMHAVEIADGEHNPHLDFLKV